MGGVYIFGEHNASNYEAETFLINHKFVVNLRVCSLTM